MQIFLRLRSSLGAVLSGLAALALILAVPSPALAHDALEGSAPASGASVATAPEEVRLDFAEQPLGIGAEVKVNDASGASWSDGAPQVVDRSVHQKLRTGAPAGAYTVVWRVVSSDSHPIEGTFTYTVTTGAALGTSPGAAGPGIQEQQPGTTATAAPAPTAPSEPFPWVIAVFALVAVGILAALGIGARRRLRAGEDGGPAPASTDES